jgi:hypothetical protein
MKYSFLKDAKFWTAVIDMLALLAIHFVGEYAPNTLGDFQFVWNTLQPILGIVVAGMFVADNVAIKQELDVPHIVSK